MDDGPPMPYTAGRWSALVMRAVEHHGPGRDLQPVRLTLEPPPCPLRPADRSRDDVRRGGAEGAARGRDHRGRRSGDRSRPGPSDASARLRSGLSTDGARGARIHRPPRRGGQLRPPSSGRSSVSQRWRGDAVRGRLIVRTARTGDGLDPVAGPRSCWRGADPRGNGWPLPPTSATASPPSSTSPRTFFINPDLTLVVHRPPVGEWVCLDARTRFGAPGHRHGGVGALGRGRAGSGGPSSPLLVEHTT